MGNKLTFDAKSGIYKVHVSGVVTVNDILESIAELKEVGVEGTLIHVLIDTLRQTSELNIMDVETVVNAMPDNAKVKSAILTTPQHINYEEQLELQKEAAKNGKAIRIFTDHEEAIHWLLAKG